MKLTVIFREKKFIVVISQNSIVNDLKEEILRVYTALFPDSCPLPTQSKIQTLTGCMLHDGYTVSSVLSDNDIITVHTDSIPDEANTNPMSILPSDSPLFCPYCGVARMGYHSPVFGNNRGYLTTSLQKHSSPAQYGHFSSVLGTPTAMSLIHSPMSTGARNTSTQCPSPERSSEDDTHPQSHTNREESNTYLHQVELGNSDHSPTPSALSHLHCQDLSTQTHEKKRVNSLPSPQSSSLIQTAPVKLHGNTPTISNVLVTTSLNDESSSSLDVTQPEVQKSASSSMKKKKKKKKLARDQVNTKSISKKKDTKKGAEVVHTSSSDSQIASTVNLKSSAGTNPASTLTTQPVVDTPGRKSQRVASVSATLRMKECIESPPSKMDVRKRKLSEKTESDPKKPKVVRKKKGITEKQNSTVQNVELEGDDTSDWISSDDDESKGHSSSKTKTTSSKSSGVTSKSKPHVSDESTSEWEDSEVEGTTTVQVATPNVSAKKLVDKNQTTSTPDSDSDEMISTPEIKVDAPKCAPTMPKSHEKSKSAKKEKSNKPRSSVKSTGGNTSHGPQRGAENEPSQESLSGSSTIQKSGTKKKRKAADDTTALSSEWSSDEEPAESVVNSHQPKPRQREKRVKHSTKSKSGQTKEPVAMPKNSQQQIVLTDTLPTESEDNSGQSSRRVQKVVSKDTESRSPRSMKLSGTPRNGTADNQNETRDSDTTTKGKSRSVGGDETKDSANAKNSGKEDTDSDNCKSQADKTLESWSTVSSPPKGVYSSWDRQRLKLKKHQSSSNLHSTEVPVTDSINKDELHSGNGVESGERKRPRSLNGGMLKEPLRSDSNEILAPNSLSDEDITAEVLSQSDDAITTIKETQESQDCSRSPSPEIPFLNHEKHSEHHSSTCNQKLQDNVTLRNKLPSYSDKDSLCNKGSLPDRRSSPHRTYGDSKADDTVDDCNKTDLCDATFIPSSQTDVSDEDIDRNNDSTTTAGCNAEAGMSQSSLRLSGINLKSENSEQSLVETEMDENNVTSESSQGKGKRKQKQKKRKRKNKTLTVVDQEESLTVSPKKLTVETGSDNTDARMASNDNDATEHTSEMSDVSEVASQSLGKKRKKHKKQQGLESTISDQQLEVISEENSTAAAPVTGSEEPTSQSPPQTTGEKDCTGSNPSSIINALSSPNHLMKESTHGPQNDASSTTLSEKTEGKDKEGFLKPMTPKKNLTPKLSPASKMNKSSEDSLSPGEQKKTKTNLLSIFSVTETELSSEESSCERVGASGSQVHRRHGKRPQQPSLLSSLGSCRRKPKTVRRIVPLSRSALLNSSSQRRFSSEVGMRMFSLTNSPTSPATRRAKLHSTPRSPKISPSKQKPTERMSPALEDALKDEGDGGKEPSLSELLADGSLWDS